VPPKPPVDKDARITALETAVAHLTDVTIKNAVAGTALRDAAIDEARKIRKQFLGGI
jgi:hypothetical protein